MFMVAFLIIVTYSVNIQQIFIVHLPHARHYFKQTKQKQTKIQVLRNPG
jgi:hypothetical protein